MALTQVNRGGLNTGISDSSNATFLTVDSSEQAVIKSDGGAVTTSVQQGLAKSWNNINGSFTIQDSFNVASCVDEGGSAPNTYTINITNAMANTTYMAHGNAETSGQNPRTIGISSPATSSYFVSCCVCNNGAENTSIVGNTAVLGDLA